MDKLTRFSGELEVSLKSEQNNTIDTVVEGLGDIRRELLIDRRVREVFEYGEPIEGNDEVDLEGIEEDE